MLKKLVLCVGLITFLTTFSDQSPAGCLEKAKNKLGQHATEAALAAVIDSCAMTDDWTTRVKDFPGKYITPRLTGGDQAGAERAFEVFLSRFIDDQYFIGGQLIYGHGAVRISWTETEGILSWYPMLAKFCQSFPGIPVTSVAGEWPDTVFQQPVTHDSTGVLTSPIKIVVRGMWYRLIDSTTIFIIVRVNDQILHAYGLSWDLRKGPYLPLDSKGRPVRDYALADTACQQHAKGVSGAIDAYYHKRLKMTQTPITWFGEALEKKEGVLLQEHFLPIEGTPIWYRTIGQWVILGTPASRVLFAVPKPAAFAGSVSTL